MLYTEILRYDAKITYLSLYSYVDVNILRPEKVLVVLLDFPVSPLCRFLVTKTKYPNIYSIQRERLSCHRTEIKTSIS